MHLRFNHPEALEMLVRTSQDTRMSLEVTNIGAQHVTFRLRVTLDGATLMTSDEVTSVRVGDTLEVPHVLNIKLTTS